SLPPSAPAVSWSTRRSRRLPKPPARRSRPRPPRTASSSPCQPPRVSNDGARRRLGVGSSSVERREVKRECPFPAGAEAVAVGGRAVARDEKEALRRVAIAL